ncbi:MAG: hypothetical protein AB4911_23235 [Oscillochloridaceae bacterium umkhey_bin13]
MEQYQLEDGDLLAYLEGEDLPHVAQALAQSPTLRQQLETLRRTKSLMTQWFDGLDRPDPQDMVDVITGQASATQQLRVAAYLRKSPVARAEYAELEQEFRALSTPARPRRLTRPTFFALPMSLGAGLRSSTPTSVAHEHSFVVAEIQAQITLRITLRSDEHWSLEGYITQDQQAAADIPVRLVAPGARPRPRTSDAAGFFSFARLRPGTYELRATMEQGILVVRDLILNDE